MMCEYCDGLTAIFDGKTRFGNYLEVNVYFLGGTHYLDIDYSSDSHIYDFNECIRIDYCPKCGKKLGGGDGE